MMRWPQGDACGQGRFPNTPATPVEITLSMQDMKDAPSSQRSFEVCQRASVIISQAKIQIKVWLRSSLGKVKAHKPSNTQSIAASL